MGFGQLKSPLTNQAPEVPHVLIAFLLSGIPDLSVVEENHSNTLMKAIELTSETFDSTLAATSLPVLVDFHAEWCGPCKMLGPIVEQVAEAKAGQAVVAKVDIDAARDIAIRFRITSVPTLIVFKDGQPVVESRGVQTKAAIESMIAQAAGTTVA